MRKIIDGSLIAVCVLTILDTDYGNFRLMDGLVFGCMALAIISSALYIAKRRKVG